MIFSNFGLKLAQNSFSLKHVKHGIYTQKSYQGKLKMLKMTEEEVYSFYTEC